MPILWCGCASAQQRNSVGIAEPCCPTHYPMPLVRCPSVCDGRGLRCLLQAACVGDALLRHSLRMSEMAANSTFDRTAGSHSLAAAGQRAR